MSAASSDPKPDEAKPVKKEKVPDPDAAAKAAAGMAKAAAAKAAREAKAQEAKAAAAKAEAAPAEDEDKLLLTNAVEGAVVTRFPPEASGFLHIGHAKAALVNSMLRHKFKGKMLFRFDDTNPEKEQAHFERAIIDDMASLGVAWDIGPTHSSQFFDLMLEKIEFMLQNDLAYADTTPKEEMRKCRFDGIPTKCRDNSKEENWRLWTEMKNATPEGQTACVRAKISIDNPNKAMRDPTLYRVNLTPHPSTGDKYKVYPTYDFCCPIVDSVEGVTHALRTNEYHDRNDQYYWICDVLGLRKPTIEDFSRLNLEYTLMSKRKLTQLVTDGVVDGWDDPRFPTVRGLLRRGLKVEALTQFVKVQGMSKATNLMEWSKLWNFNNQILDPSVARYTAVNDDLKVRVNIVANPALPETELVQCSKLRHKKNEALGSKTYYKAATCFIEAEDVLLVKEGEEVTLMDWCNAFISNIVKDDAGMPVSCTATLNPEGDVKKTKYKLTWLPENPKSVPCTAIEYDHLLAKKKPEEGDELRDILNPVTKHVMQCVGEEAMAELKKGDSLQIERRGFYIVDSVAPMVLIAIPDGRDKVNHLSAKAQFLKKNPPPAAAAAAKPAAAKEKAPAKAPAADDGMTLEEKRAAKAAKKAAAAKK